MSRPPVDYIERTREQYASLGYPPYQWVHNEDAPPFAPVSKPLAESRIGLHRLGRGSTARGRSRSTTGTTSASESFRATPGSRRFA